MMSPIAAKLGAFIAGCLLASIAVVGGVSAATPTANAPKLSDEVVYYDAP